MKTVEICLFLYGAIIIFSKIVERYLPVSTDWETLQKQYPQLKSIQDKREANSTRNFLIIMMVVVLSLLLTYISAQYKIEIVAVIFLFLALVEVVDGVETLSNGVYTIKIARSFVQYVYDEKKEFEWVAKAKIVFASIVSLVIAVVLVQYFLQYLGYS